MGEFQIEKSKVAVAVLAKFAVDKCGQVFDAYSFLVHGFYFFLEDSLDSTEEISFHDKKCFFFVILHYMFFG